MKIMGDNSTLQILSYLDKQAEIDSTSPDIGTEFMLNWEKTPENQEGLKKASQRFKALKEDGFNNDQALEMLLAEDHREEDINAIASVIEQMTKKAKTQKTQPVKIAQSYSDIAENVRTVAVTEGAEKFQNIVTAGGNMQYGIMRLAGKNVKDLTGIIRDMQEAPYPDPFVNEFDTLVSPFFNDEIEKSHLTAKALKTSSSISKQSKTGLAFVSDGNEVYAVDVNRCSCECKRSQDGNFATFNVPCEHVVLASE